MTEKFVSLSIHPRDRLSKIAPQLNLGQGRFFISVAEFNGRVKGISCDTERIKSFTIFPINNYERIKQRRQIFGDMKTLVGFLFKFIENQYVNPKELFETICSKYQFEFSLLHDLSREYINKKNAC